MITGVNDAARVATNTGVTLTERGEVTITTDSLRAVDPDDAPADLTFTVTTGPTQGALLVNGDPSTSFTQQDLIDNEVAYTHTGSNVTDDSFVFELTDDEGAGPIDQTFAITVVNVNDPPEARDDDVVTDEDFEASASAPGLLGNDTDPDAEDEITVSAVNGSAIDVGTVITLESGALLTLNADGAYMYDPNGQFDSLARGEAATDNFTYTASDGNGGTDQATVTVTINGVNDLPSITSGESSEVEENQTSTNYTATADDPDGDPVTFSLSGGVDQSAFSIDPEGGGLTFDTAPDFENPRDANQDNDYEVEVQASDGNGGTDTQAVTVTVTGVNDPPVLETNKGFTVVQGDSVSLSADSLRTSDVDNEPTEITYSVIQPPSQGQLLLQETQTNRFTQRDLEDGRVRYAHTADNASNDIFTFDVRDPGGTGPTGEVAITVLDRTPPSVPDSVRATSAFGEVTVAWEESPEGDLAGYNLYRSTSSFDDVSAARQVNDGFIEEASFTDQGGTAGTTHFYRVTAVDTTGNESTVSPEVQGLPREPTVPVQVTRTFDDPESEQSYALVGLPGSVSLRVSDIFADVSSDDWIAYREDGAEGAEPFSRTKCGASASCRFQTGNGFWVLANGAFTVEEAFSNVAISQESDFGISIQDGWNVVSNPFERDVPWSAVQQASGTNQPLWAWNGTWAQASTFASAKDGVAYYFRDDAIDELRVPFDPALTSQSIAEKEEHRVPVDVRTLTLSLKRGGEVQSTVSLGMRPDAKPSLDRYDVFAPPGYFQDDLLRLMREADGQTNLLAAEYQPGSEEGQSFHLTIQADPRTAPALSVEGGSAFDGEIRLVHQGSGKTYDLKEQSKVAPTLQKREEQFTVLIGSQRFVEEKSQEAVSGKSRLVSTYPNPFRGRVTIEYVLAEATTVTLTVYDVLGRRVAVVARGEESSGHHTIRWRPRQQVRELGSGVYFLRLEAGNVIDTQKLTIIK
jgi:VCBS repeat-containing protein